MVGIIEAQIKLHVRGEIKLLKWRFKPPFFSPHHPPRIPDTSTRTTENYGRKNAEILLVGIREAQLKFNARGEIKLLKWRFKPPFFPPHHPPCIPDTSTQTTQYYGRKNAEILLVGIRETQLNFNVQ